MGRLSIVTLNTWKCDGDYAARLKLMLAEAARLAPDMLLLQEAFAAPKPGADTAAALARRLSYNLAWQPAREKPRNFGGGPVMSASGLAVLTRGRIMEAHGVTLPMDRRDGERIAQLVTVELAGARMLVINLHLVYFDDRDDLRIAELEALCAALPALGYFDAVLMGGDFNCEWESAPMRWLRSRPNFRIVNPHRAGGTDRSFPTHGGFNDARPPRCIDFLLQLVPKDSRPGWRLAEPACAFAEPDPGGLYPSDHVGVRATAIRL